MILRRFIQNAVSIATAAFIVFLIHWFVNIQIDSPITISELLYAYIMNVIMALGVIAVLYVFRRKLKDQLGFIFMAASMLKFVFFFLLFYPIYTSDDYMSRYEFFTFFIPYVICLIVECIILSRFLNRLDTAN